MKPILKPLLIFIFWGGSYLNIYGQLIPNGDFEHWGESGHADLVGWKSNACPMCVPACITDIFMRDTVHRWGRFSALLLARGCRPCIISTTFPLTKHSSALTGYLKKHDINDSTVIIVKLFKNGMVVDSGKLVNNESMDDFTLVTVPITQHSTEVDSAEVMVRFGNFTFHDYHATHFTEIPKLWIDYFSFKE